MSTEVARLDVVIAGKDVSASALLDKLEARLKALDRGAAQTGASFGQSVGQGAQRGASGVLSLAQAEARLLRDQGNLAASADRLRGALQGMAPDTVQVINAQRQLLSVETALEGKSTGLAAVLSARVLAEFGDDKNRYADARARKNYAGTSPITRTSGKKRVVLARHIHNDRLVDAIGLQAFAALRASPGARAYYDHLRARGVGHRAALRQLGNRLVGILHGCLKTRTPYREDTAWPDLTARAA